MRTIGHDNAINYLKNAYLQNSFAHFYIFHGPEHVGKTTLAYDFVKLLNCTSKENEFGCESCENCKKINFNNYYDLICVNSETPIESTSSNSSDQIRIGHIHQINHSANLGPFIGKYKTFLIENAQNLNNEASNAFLKLLEEPPKGSIFIFLVSDLSKLYPTILSRAQKISLSELRNEQIEDWIKQKYDYDRETIKKIVQFSQGLLGKAFLVSENISLLEEYKESYNRFYEFCNSALSNRLNISQKLSTRFRTDRNGIYQELNNWMNFCDLIIKKNFEKDLNFIFDFDLKKTYSIMEINKIIITLLRSINNLQINVNSRLVFDVMSLDIPEKQNSVR